MATRCLSFSSLFQSHAFPRISTGTSHVSPESRNAHFLSQGSVQDIALRTLEACQDLRATFSEFLSTTDILMARCTLEDALSHFVALVSCVCSARAWLFLCALVARVSRVCVARACQLSWRAPLVFLCCIGAWWLASLGRRRGLPGFSTENMEHEKKS